MMTFVVLLPASNVGGNRKRGHDLADRLDRIRSRLVRLFPDHDFNAIVDDIGILVVTGSELQPPVNVHANDSRFVVVYGESDQPGVGNPAQWIDEAYCGGKKIQLDSLFGCYGAVIHDRTSKTTILTSDGLAQRSLRWVSLGDYVAVSPHDLPLVAAGCSTEPRAVALAGLIRFGWSFGGESSLASVKVVGAEETHIVGSDGKVTVTLNSLHEAAANKRKIAVSAAEVREAIIDDMIAYLRHAHTPEMPVEVELSAGFDSRVVLALALAAMPADVSAFSDGPERSQDVRVGRAVAKAVNVRHRAGGIRNSTESQRLTAVKELARATNGQATLMPIMTGGFDGDRPESLGGDGGEVFRGYYYPKIGRGGISARYEPERMTDTVMRRFTIGRPWLKSAHEEELRQHVRRRLEKLVPLCIQESDALDLLYLLERTGTWNQKLRRLSTRRYNPFYSRAATYAYLSLPGTRGRIARIHETVMQRYVPQARWILLNGETIPALMSGGPLAQRASRAFTLAAKIAWKLLDRLGWARAGTGGHDLEALRASTFREHLRKHWSELFSPEHSVVRNFLGDETMDDLLKRAALGDRAAQEVLATVVVAEYFFADAKQVAGP